MGAQWNDGRRFEGRVAVVTGGGGTLGGAVARGFGSEGASVAIGYRSSRSQAAEVVGELEGLGGQAHSGSLDVTDRGMVRCCSGHQQLSMQGKARKGHHYYACGYSSSYGERAALEAHAGQKWLYLRERIASSAWSWLSSSNASSAR
jgi:NAD(P)-dependent dehydrogenase (short-subunit alcohol dehydrogenase family)